MKLGNVDKAYPSPRQQSVVNSGILGTACNTGSTEEQIGRDNKPLSLPSNSYPPEIRIPGYACRAPAVPVTTGWKVLDNRLPPTCPLPSLLAVYWVTLGI